MSIELRAITKSFGEVTVVRGIDLRIATGELCVLLGPSGSGKSTLLRIVAGLEEPDDGRVLLHDEDVTRADPRRRGIGFVFQHYALFRHLTVADNVEFPLRVQKVARAQRRARREELLELVGLAGYGGRRPGQLSGGQQQRVALARALASAPRVLLLDEPFGALDARIRVELRHAIRRIHRELGITTVFVTHDQEEAFALADRLAVLGDGRLLEVGAPADLYLHPRQERVATFLGDANVLVGEASERGVRLGEVELPLGVTAEKAPGGRVRVVFRPEDVQLGGAAGAGAAQLGLARVEEATFAGSFERLRLRLPTPPGVRGVAPPAPFGSAFVWLDAIRPQPEARRLPLQSGDEVQVAVRRVHVLASGGAAAAGARPRPARAKRPGRRRASPPRSPSARRRRCRRRARRRRPTAGTSRSSTSPRRAPRPRATCPGPEVDHLLFVNPGAALPRRILVCIAVGEPGKEDVSFAERLAWRLAAQVTVLTVLPGPQSGAPTSRAPVPRCRGARPRASRRRGDHPRASRRAAPGDPCRDRRGPARPAGHGRARAAARPPVRHLRPGRAAARRPAVPGAGGALAPPGGDAGRPIGAGAERPVKRPRSSAVPGFGLTFGAMMLYLSLVVLIPLAALLLRAARVGPRELLAAIGSERALAAFGLSFGGALVAAVIAAVGGSVAAWVLVRYRFPGRRLLDALVDLPFALPTAVSGIALATLLAPQGWVGQMLAPLGWKLAYTRGGVVVAMVLVALPFIVRTLQPALADLPLDVEEAAATLGGGRLRTVFSVVAPQLLPALWAAASPSPSPAPSASTAR